MVARKTQKKHLGKKRKSLSKRKAHSKKKRHYKQRITKKRYHKGGNMSKAKKIHNKKVNEKNEFLEKLREFILKDNEELIKNAFNPEIKEGYFNYLKQRLLACINGEKIEGFYEGNWKEVDQVYVDNLEYIIKHQSSDEVLKNRLLTCIKKATETKLDKFFDELIKITEKYNDLNPLKTNLENKINEYHDGKIKKELQDIITNANEVKDLQDHVQVYVLDEQEKNFEERNNILDNKHHDDRIPDNCTISG